MENKNILIGISGSIAAYKAAFLIRLLVKEKANVQVVATPDSLNFITPLTLSTLSRKPVFSEFVLNENGEWTNHVELGLWADLIIIAPATANTIAKMANGICDNLLLATYFSAKCKTMVAPAMDLDMYLHPSNQNNLSKLNSFGNEIIPVENGELASGLIGNGRMAEPETIVQFIKNHFQSKQDLLGLKALVTAGPTYENIDPVRFIGNRSSGKMGYAIANELKNRGCNVTLISGPVALEKPNGIIIVYVESADEMLKACLTHFENSDITIKTAAVADFTVTNRSDKKIKKESGDETLSLMLEKTTDILKTLGTLKKENQILVGFALETDNEKENALKKLKTKNLDLVILNSLKDKGAGFQHDTNQVSIIGKSTDFKTDLLDKKEIAKIIVDTIVTLKNAKN